MKYPILESAIIKYGIPKKQLAEELGLTQAGISRMIEWAYDRLEIKGGGSDDNTENP